MQDRLAFLDNSVHYRDVKIVRWPTEREKLDQYRAHGIPRVVVVEGGEKAPLCYDIYEDWVRAPFREDDLENRIKLIYMRVRAESNPRLDENGILYYMRNSVALSPVQARLVEYFVRQPGRLVHRGALLTCLGQELLASSRNSLDLHMMRIRRKLAPLGLYITTVRGRGYQLDISTKRA